jgi:hypothetical protein
MLSRSIYSDSWMYNVGPLSRTIRSNVDYGVSLCHAYSTDNEDSQHSHALIQQFRTCHSNSTIKIIANNPFPFDSPHSSYKKPDYPGYRIVHFRKEKKNSCRNSSRKHGKVCLEHGALLSFASHRRFSLQCPCYVACNSHAQTTAARIKHAQGERVGSLDNSLLGPRRPLRRHVIRSMGLAGSSSLVYTLASSST